MLEFFKDDYFGLIVLYVLVGVLILFLGLNKCNELVS